MIYDKYLAEFNKTTPILDAKRTENITLSI